MDSSEFLIEPLRGPDCEEVAAWNSGRGEDFLYQWGMPHYSYPLDEEQIQRRIDQGAGIYAVRQNGDIIATAEILAEEKGGAQAYIGHYLVDPSLSGRGLGTRVMTAFARYCFKTGGYEAIRLSVYDFNIPAQKCYQKVGFVKYSESERSNGWLAYEMILNRSRYDK